MWAIHFARWVGRAALLDPTQVLNPVKQSRRALSEWPKGVRAETKLLPGKMKIIMHFFAFKYRQIKPNKKQNIHSQYLNSFESIVFCLDRTFWIHGRASSWTTLTKYPFFLAISVIISKTLLFPYLDNLLTAVGDCSKQKLCQR